MVGSSFVAPKWLECPGSYIDYSTVLTVGELLIMSDKSYTG